MSSTNQPVQGRIQKNIWIVFMVLGIVLVINILMLIVIPFEEIFEDDTGTSWVEFSDVYPDVANSYLLEQRLFYASFIGIAFFALATTWWGFRNGQGWTWYAMWLLPIHLTVSTFLLFTHNPSPVSAFYAFFAVIAVLGMALSYRTFFPAQ